MLKLLYPHIYVKSIYELPLTLLKEKGIRALVFDIDNTISPFDVEEPDSAAVALFHRLKTEGFRCCLLSNNNKKRVNRFNQKLNLYCVARAGKPGSYRLRKAIREMGATPATTAMIGDQVFTDVLCGHLGGTLTILTRPICNRDQFVTKIKRGLERWILKSYFKSHGE